MNRLIGHQLALLVVVMCLSACAHVSPSLVVPERISYTVPRLPESQFVFEDYLEYTQQLAARWDEHARLNSVSRQTRCDAHEQVAEQKLLVSFWRPTQFWFGQRIEWFDVSELPAESVFTVLVWTSLDTTWDRPPIDLASVALSYAEALKISMGRGGAEFMGAHPSCYLTVGLRANQWRFVYSLDRWQAQGEPLKLCIDGKTGEPCDFLDFDWQAP